MNWPLDAKLKLLAAIRTEQWRETARPEQLHPDGDWRYWYVQGGRGAGKTRTGAEWLAELALRVPGEYAIVAPTYGAAHDVCIEGPRSGLLTVCGGRKSQLIRNYWKSTGQIEFCNGSIVYVDGADDGAYRIQGKNLNGAWCDEVGLWAHGWEESWKIALRGAVRFAPAQLVCTGTPKQGHPLVRLLTKHPRCVVTKMRTADNAPNLDEQWFEELVEEHRDTRYYRQELEGEFLDEPMGALWTLSQIDSGRVEHAPQLDRIVVGVDPSGTPSEDTGVSETGIVVAGFNHDLGHGYVLADCSMHASPQQWGAQVVAAYRGAFTGGLAADVVVVEKNFGGEMVRSTINAIDPHVPVRVVTASRGKAPRAEPVAAKYEQGRVHHVGEFSRLEEQMVGWIPGDPRQPSPDRMDALVWALTELMIDKHGASAFVYAPARGQELEYARGDYVAVGDHYHDKG